MPRNGSDIYAIPPGTEGFPDTTIESNKYNSYIHDVETDLNMPRPVSVGGTGATSADGALVSLHAEKAGQQIFNFDSDVWMAGSFYSLTSATAPPVAGHAFSGIAHITNANTMVVEAVDLTDTLNTPWMRVKTAGVWSAWIQGVTKNFVEVHAAITCSDTPPTGNNASDNALWFESDTGLLYIRYNDGDTTQWTIACPQPDISAYAIKTETDAALLLKADKTYVDTQDALKTDKTYVDTQDGTRVAKIGDTMTGDLTITKATPAIVINKAANGQDAAIYGRTNGLNRWKLVLGTTGLESSGNVGSDFALLAYDDAGNAVAPAAFLVDRSTGLMTLKADPTATFGAATKQYVDARGTPYLQNSVVFDLPPLAPGAVATAQTLTVTGAAAGDFCLASFSGDLGGMTLLAWVSAANTVSFQFQNKTAGTIDLASGTVRVRVWKQ